MKLFSIRHLRFLTLTCCFVLLTQAAFARVYFIKWLALKKMSPSAITDASKVRFHAADDHLGDNSNAKALKYVTLSGYPVDGTQDAAFGNSGSATSNFGFGKDMALDTDGKIVMAGYSKAYALVVARFQQDGTPDASFNGTGDVSADISASIFHDDFTVTEAVAVQPDHKIIAAGVSAMERFNPDGSLDPTFGIGKDGEVADINYYPGSVTDLLLQSDHKIVAVSDAGAISRYNPDGSLDPTFGQNGKVFFDLGEGGLCSGRGRAALASDGGIVVLFGCLGRLDGIEMALLRCRSDGSLDGSFGHGGKVFTSFGKEGGEAGGYGLSLDTKGRILVSGNAYGDSSFLMRFNANGDLDKAFGQGGVAVSKFADLNIASAVLAQNNGKILVGVNSINLDQNRASNDPSIVRNILRYKEDGTLDETFGPKGSVSINVLSDTDTCILAQQADGNILVGGGFNFPVSRILSAAADLSLSDSMEEKAPVKSDHPVTYDLAVSNHGPRPADHVTLTDRFDTYYGSQVNFVSAVSSAGSCNGSMPVTCDFGTMKPGESATVKVTVEPEGRGRLESTATLSSDLPELNFGDNTAHLGTDVGIDSSGAGPTPPSAPKLIKLR